MSNSVATLLNGKELALSFQKIIKHEIDLISQKFLKFTPHLSIVQVGNHDDSNVYIKMKKSAGIQTGIKIEHIQLSSSVSEDEVRYIFVI